MSCPDECFKIDMGCNCPPPAPDKPRPFVFAWLGGSTTEAQISAVVLFSSVAGAVTSYIIANPGLNYRVAPTITIGGAGTGATATCIINSTGQIVSVTITAAGTGYGTVTASLPSTGISSTVAPTPTNSILLDSLSDFHSIPVVHSESPLVRLTASPPSGGGITLASAKINMIISYTIKTNGVTNLVGTFYVNGVPVATSMTIDNTSASYTPVTHYSGELSLNYADSVTYKITSTESKLIDLTNCTGIFSVKYI